MPRGDDALPLTGIDNFRVLDTMPLRFIVERWPPGH